ncbi:MAG: 3-phosphoshikimate 1-carboxyvinyltransferase [Acidobacteria bacterium]|nr:3-phosphoshikimate 1-carboxyvinyltransferase [Acidobacteriota bacterium]
MRGSVSPGMVSGRVHAPASKSFMQRVVACAVLSDTETIIQNPSLSDDGHVSLKLAADLGADVDRKGKNVTIRPGCHDPGNILNAGESGLSLRMFAPVAARLPFSVIIEASGTLCHRPVGMMGNSFRQLGVSFESKNNLPPVHINGPLHGGKVDVEGTVTSQFLSGLLIALPGCPENSEIRVSGLASRPYVDMTLSVLESFGICWQVEEEELLIFRSPGHQRLHCSEFTVPGDWSAATALFVAGAIGGPVTVTGLSQDSLQGDRTILNVLEQAGASVSISGDSVTVSRDHLDGFQFDVTEYPDMVPALVALAVHCNGETIITGTSRLKFKESDRARVLKREFGRLGANVKVTDDAVTVVGGMLSGGYVSAAGDHRIAMALAVSGLNANGPVEIDEAECVDKSYPGFFEDLVRIGAKIKLESKGKGAWK